MRKASVDHAQEASWGKVFWAFVILAVIFLVRLGSPWRTTDSMSVYEGITHAIITQQNWGKQAIVGALEYSPLPAIGLLLLSPLKKLGISSLVSPPHVLVALCQAWVIGVVYLIFRIGIRRRIVAATASIVLVSLVAAGLTFSNPAAAFRADPFWVCLVPVAGLVLFLLRWLRTGGMRDLMLLSLLSGLIAFCGPSGFLISLFTILGVVTMCRSRMAENNATIFLVAMPLLYAIILHWLFNLLIMGDGLFGLKRIYRYVASGAGNPTQSVVSTAAVLGILIVGAIALTLWLKGAQAPRITWLYVLALLPAMALRENGRILLGGEFLLAGFGLVPLAAGLLVTRPGEKRFSPDMVFAAVVGLLLAAGVPFIQQGSLTYESFSAGARPSKEELCRYVDSRWKGSRFLVFGLRTSVLYCQSESSNPRIHDRFIGRLDLNQYVLRSRIEEEQLHILIPPDNGIFYPRSERSFFSRLHRTEQPEWLFLEETWAGKGRVGAGWQLWRCIRKLDEQGDSY